MSFAELHSASPKQCWMFALVVLEKLQDPMPCAGHCCLCEYHSLKRREPGLRLPQFSLALLTHGPLCAFGKWRLPELRLNSVLQCRRISANRKCATAAGTGPRREAEAMQPASRSTPDAGLPPNGSGAAAQLWNRGARSRLPSRLCRSSERRSCWHASYLPSSCAFLIISRRYCFSFALRRVSSISSNAATALSGDPPKNVFTRCFKAESRTWPASSAGTYTYLRPSCSWRRYPLSSSSPSMPRT